MPTAGYSSTFYSCHDSILKRLLFGFRCKFLHPLFHSLVMNVYLSAVQNLHTARLFASLALQLGLRQLAFSTFGAAKAL